MNRRARFSGRQPLSLKLQEQAATARLVATLRPGPNGGHILELGTQGMLGFLRTHRALSPDLRRALDWFDNRCAELDAQPETIFPRPAERQVF